MYHTKCMMRFVYIAFIDSWNTGGTYIVKNYLFLRLF